MGTALCFKRSFLCIPSVIPSSCEDNSRHLDWNSLHWFSFVVPFSKGMKFSKANLVKEHLNKLLKHRSIKRIFATQDLCIAVVTLHFSAKCRTPSGFRGYSEKGEIVIMQIVSYSEKICPKHQWMKTVKLGSYLEALGKEACKLISLVEFSSSWCRTEVSVSLLAFSHRAIDNSLKSNPPRASNLSFLSTTNDGGVGF